MANGEILTERKAVKDGLSPVEVWLKHVERAKEDEREWRDVACEAIKVYEASEGEGETRTNFNILHSNIETIVPALYNSTPIPDIRRRFGDADFAAKQGVDIIERGVSYAVDQYDIDGVMTEVVRDSELAGRGVSRVRYKPQMRQVTGPDGMPYEDVGYQETSCEHVQWDKWGHGPGRSWDDVKFVYFEHDLTSDDLEDMGLDEERISKLTFDDASKDRSRTKDKKADAGIFKTIKAYEVWDKRRKLVWFVTPQDKQEPLLVEEDPLKLPGFFPVPKPVQPLRKRGSLTPICPYEVYRPLVEELEAITKRITALIKQLKVRGLIDKGLAEDFERLKLNEDGQYEPADNAAMFAGGGGLEKAIAHWPMEPTVKALEALYIQREQIKSTIYEVSGISDIIRGATDPNETLGAQQIKAQWGSQRVQRRQSEVARFARDLFRMKAALMCRHFTTENLSAMTQIPIAPEVEQILRSDAMRGYRIDIESDSTIRADMSRSQEQMNLFLQGTGTYTQAVAGLVQAMPQSLPTWVEVYIAFARKFKLGKQAEDALEQLSQMAQQIAEQAAAQAAQPQPDPNAIEREKLDRQDALERERMDREDRRHSMQMEMDFERERARQQAEPQIGPDGQPVPMAQPSQPPMLMRQVASEAAAVATQSSMGEVAKVFEAQAAAINQLINLVAESAMQTQSLKAAVSAPKRVIRDASGRVAGVETVPVN